MNRAASTQRNPGPNWGYAFLTWAERWWPRWAFRPAFMAGTWVGLACMPVQRAHSRDFLPLVLGRPARLTDVWRHFFAFAEFLMLKLRVARTGRICSRLLPEHAAEFEKLADSREPALFGTFHFGCSDLLGYMLGDRISRVSVIRLEVANSDDTRRLGERFEGRVSFLWVSETSDLLFGIKHALDSGESLAMKCDRVEFTTKVEVFDYLGVPRRFPFAIYHLAILTGRPVVFCIAVPGSFEDEIEVTASAVFRAEPAAGRAVNLDAARVHFRSVLDQLEGLNRQFPFLWFNFQPMNPESPRAGKTEGEGEP